MTIRAMFRSFVVVAVVAASLTWPPLPSAAAAAPVALTGSVGDPAFDAFGEASSDWADAVSVTSGDGPLDELLRTMRNDAHLTSVASPSSRQADPSGGTLETAHAFGDVQGVPSIRRSLADDWYAAVVQRSSDQVWTVLVSDGGNVWSDVGYPVDAPQRSLDMAIDSDGSVYLVRPAGIGPNSSVSLWRRVPNGTWGSTTSSCPRSNNNDPTASVLEVDGGQLIIALGTNGCLWTSTDSGANLENVGRRANVEHAVIADGVAHLFVGPGSRGCQGGFYTRSYYRDYARIEMSSGDQLASEQLAPFGCQRPGIGVRLTGEVYSASMSAEHIVARSGLELSTTADNGNTWTALARREPLPMRSGPASASTWYGLSDSDDLDLYSISVDDSSSDLVRTRRTMDPDVVGIGTTVETVESASGPALPDFTFLPRTHAAQPVSDLIGFTTADGAVSTVTATWQPKEPSEPKLVESTIGIGLPLSIESDVSTSSSGEWSTFVARPSASEPQHVFRRHQGGVVQDLGALHVDVADVDISDAGVVTALGTVTARPCDRILHYVHAGEWYGPVHVGQCVLGPLISLETSVEEDGAFFDVSTLALLSGGSGPANVASTLYLAEGGFTWTRSVATADVRGDEVIAQGAYLHSWTNSRLGRWNLADSSFESFDLPAGAGPVTLLVSPSDENTLYMVRMSGPTIDVASSVDFGESWTFIDDDLPFPGAAATSNLAIGADGLLHLYDARTCLTGSFFSRWKRELATGSPWSPGETLWTASTRRASRPTVPRRPDGIVEPGTQVAFAQIGDDLVAWPTDVDSVGGALGLDAYASREGGVSIGLGNFTWTMTDASVQSAGLPLEIQRTYNSASTASGLFGPGWSTPFDIAAQTNCATGGVTVTYPDGRWEDHSRAVDGPFEPAPGYGAALVAAGGRYRLTQVNGNVHEFDVTTGRVVAALDPTGKRQVMSYNEELLTAVTDQTSGRSLFFDYADGAVVEVRTDPVTVGDTTEPLTWSYGYANGRLERSCSATDPDLASGHCTLFTTGSGGRVTHVADSNGHTDVAVGYDQAGRVEWQEDGVSNRTTYDRSEVGRVVTTDARGSSISVSFDSRFREVEVIDPFGGATTNSYDGNGFLYRIVDANGLETTRTFNDRGQPLSETNGAGETRWFEYDLFGNATATSDGRSAGPGDSRFETSTTWDAPRRIQLTVTTPSTPSTPSGVTTMSYTDGSEAAIGGGTAPAVLLSQVTDPAGAVTTYSYDSQGDLRTVIDDLGFETRFTTDELGRVTTQTQISQAFPTGAGTRFEYDEAGRITRVLGPMTTNWITGDSHRLSTSNVYDSVGNLLATTQRDVGGATVPDRDRQSTITYDSADRPVGTTTLGGGTTSTAYDPSGNVVRRTDGLGRTTTTAYDLANQPVTIHSAPAGDDAGAGELLWSGEYDPGGRLIAQSDPLDRRVTTVYDSASRPISRTLQNWTSPDGNDDGFVLDAVTYDDAGNPIVLSRGNGSLVEERVIDEAGRLLQSTTDPLGLAHVTDYVYDEGGRPLEVSTSDGDRTERERYEYDSLGNVTQRQIENGLDDITEVFAFDDRGLMVSAVDPRGTGPGADADAFTTEFEHDEQGRLVAVVGPVIETYADGVTLTLEQSVERTGFNAFGEQTAIADARGNVTTALRDQLGRVVGTQRPSIVRSDGTTITSSSLTEYDVVGNAIAVVDASGARTDYQYDYRNRLVTVIDPVVGDVRGTTLNDYDAAGNLVRTTNQIGAVTSYEYDVLDRMVGETDVVRSGGDEADTWTTRHEYDDLGNAVATTTALGHTSEATYSAKSELLTYTDPTGAVTSYSYDVRSRRIGERGPDGRGTAAEYDLAGRMLAEHRLAANGAVLATTTFGHDPAGNVTSETSPRGVATETIGDFTSEFDFDAAGRLVRSGERINSTSVIESLYRYDVAGNLTAQVDGRGNATTYSFNARNLITRVTEPTTSLHPDVAHRSWVTDFDSRGYPVVEVQPGGVRVERDFDPLGRETSVTGSDGDVSLSVLTSYDAASRMVRASSPAGAVSFSYDDRDQVVRSVTNGEVARFSYDADNRLVRQVDSRGVTRYRWTSRGEVRSVSDPVSADRTVQFYDAAGRPTRTRYAGGAERRRSYDAWGRLRVDRLEDAQGDQAAQTEYRYDRNDNLTRKIVDMAGNPSDGTHRYRYDQSNRLTKWTAEDGTETLYRWDRSNNRVRAGDERFRYDERNRLRSTTSGDSYRYEPRGGLVRSSEDGVVIDWTFDQLGRLSSAGGTAYEYDALNRLIEIGDEPIVYAGTSIEAISVGDEQIARWPDGVPVASAIGGEASQFLITDSHQDVTAAFGGDATLAGSTVFDPFGNIVGSDGVTSVLGFQSDVLDTDTGATWMGARWYQSERAGFISRDGFAGVVGVGGSLNRYGYGLGSPLGWWDPSGFEAVRGGGAVLADVDDRVAGRGVGELRAPSGRVVIGGEGRSFVDQPLTSQVAVSPPPASGVSGVVTVFASATAGVACAAGAAAMTKNAAAVGAAASFCAGAANRFVGGLFNGQGVAESAIGALWTPSTLVDTAAGAVGGFAAGRVAASGVSGVRAFAAGGGVDAGVGFGARAGNEFVVSRDAGAAIAAGADPGALIAEIVVGGTLATKQPHTTTRNTPPPGPEPLAPSSSGAYTGGGVDRTFTHFTDEAGVVGITGARPRAVGDAVDVGQLTFEKGQNSFQANAPGDIFVTDLPPTASSGQLNGIGVFGNKQQYAISFSEVDAFSSGVRVRGGAGPTDRGIFTVPGGCTINGAFSVTRVR